MRCFLKCFFFASVMLLAQCHQSINDNEITNLPSDLKLVVDEQRKDGWQFLQVVGEVMGSYADNEGQEVRYSQKGMPHRVFAMCTGVDGGSSAQLEFVVVFESDVLQYKEVKVMTSPGDCYSLIFTRPFNQNLDSTNK